MRLAYLALAAAACHSAPSATPSNKAESNLRATAADELGFLPIDAQIVVGLDVAQLRSSAMWQKFEPLLARAAQAQLDMARNQCGFDPLSAIQRITIAGAMVSDNKFNGVLVIRGVDSGKALDCVTKSTAKTGGTATNQGGVLVVSQPNQPMMALAAAGPTTVVAQILVQVSHDSMKAVLASGSPLRGSTAFMGLYQRREAGSTVWAMVNGNAKALEQLASVDMRPKSIDGTLTVTDRLSATVRATFDRPDQATKVVDEVNKAAALARMYVEKLEARANGSTAQIDGAMTQDQVINVLKMLGGRDGP